MNDGQGLIYEPGRGVKLRAKVQGLAARAKTRWMAVTIDGKWITAAGLEDDHGGPALIWRSEDDLLGEDHPTSTPARHLLLARWHG